MRKAEGLYQSEFTSSLTCIHGQVTKHRTAKWHILISLKSLFLLACLVIWPLIRGEVGVDFILIADLVIMVGSIYSSSRSCFFEVDR